MRINGSKKNLFKNLKKMKCTETENSQLRNMIKQRFFQKTEYDYFSLRAI